LRKWSRARKQRVNPRFEEPLEVAAFRHLRRPIALARAGPGLELMLLGAPSTIARERVAGATAALPVIDAMLPPLRASSAAGQIK
jgi:hypothetical protein